MAINLVELEIDGLSVSMPSGSTVMQAAKKLGIEIPHFCYHPKLSIAANCRMCLVQTEKMPKPVPACATPVMPGMKVFTHSDQAIAAQKGVMELMLINHPLDCPICDQGGECQLQDLSMGYGGHRSYYHEEKRVVINKNLGPLIATDMTRCIHCTRCVRFGEEIGGFMELGMANRGEHSEIMTFMHGTVDSEISGNAIDLCPVGALTSKPFRFSARGWELTSISGISPHDSLGSRLRIQVFHDAVYRVLPETCEAINECWISDRDRFSYTALNQENRLMLPMIREKSFKTATKSHWREMSWHEAFGRLVDLHRHTPAHQVQVCANPNSTLEELALMARLAELAEVNVVTGLRRQSRQAHHRWFGGKIKHIQQASRFLIVGSFLRQEQPLIAARLRRAVRQGAHVNRLHVAAESWNMPINAEATVLPTRLAATLALLIERIAKIVDQPLSESVAALVSPLIKQSSVNEDIHQSVDAIAKSLLSVQKDTDSSLPSIRIFLGHYAEQHPQASFFAKLVDVLSALLNKQGHYSEWGYLLAGANTVGAQAVGIDQPLSISEETSASIYWLYRMEAESDTVDRPAFTKALAQAKTIVSFSSFMPSYTASEDVDTPIHIVLPIAGFTEQAGTMINGEGRVQSFTAAVTPPGEVRPGWKVLRYLAEQLSQIGGNGYGNLGSAFRHFDDTVSIRNDALSRSRFGTLSRCGYWLIDLQNTVSDDLTADFEVSPSLVTEEPAEKLFERVSGVGLYWGDPVLRQAPPLQQTYTAAHVYARFHPADIEALSLQENRLYLIDADQRVMECAWIADDGVVPGSVLLPSGHPSIPFADHACLQIHRIDPLTLRGRGG